MTRPRPHPILRSPLGRRSQRSTPPQPGGCCWIRRFLASMNSMLSRRYSGYVSISRGTEGVLKSSNAGKTLTAEQCSETRSWSRKKSTYPLKFSNNVTRGVTHHLSTGCAAAPEARVRMPNGGAHFPHVVGRVVPRAA